MLAIIEPGRVQMTAGSEKAGCRKENLLEGEYMKEDEYDMFLDDPSGFMLRCYLPRVYRSLVPLAGLPPLDRLFAGFEAITPLFAGPEFRKMARHPAKAGKQVRRFHEIVGDASEEPAQLGFPSFAGLDAGGVGGAPFDTLTLFLRGMKGSMLDLYRRPDKLLRACDAILERRIAIPADPSGQGDSGRPHEPPGPHSEQLQAMVDDPPGIIHQRACR